MFEIAVNVYESLLMTFFHYSLTETHRPKALLSSVLYFICIFLFITYINLFSSSELFLQVIEIGMTYVYLCLVTYLKPGKRMMYSSFWFPVIAASNVILVFSISLMLYKEIRFDLLMANYRIPVVTLVQAVHTLLFFLICKKVRSLNVEMTEKENILGCFMFLLFDAMCICFQGVMLNEEQSTIYMMIGIYLACGGLISFVWLFQSIAKHHISEMKKDLKIQEYYSQASSAEKLLRKQEEVNQIRHDLKHMIQYLPDSANNTKIEDILKRYHLSEEEQMPLITIVPSVNNVLNIKREEARAKNIDFRCELNITEDPEIEDTDMYLLLSNLLDNAISHIGMEKKIRLKIQTVDRMLLIEQSNSADVPVFDYEGNLIHDYAGNEHGFGLRTIRMVAEKYNGFADFSQNGHMINVKIMIQFAR